MLIKLLSPGRWGRFFLLLTSLSTLLLFVDIDGGIQAGDSAATGCIYWVAPPPAGNDSHPGTAASPWATIKHASDTVPDAGCQIWFEDGQYFGNSRLNRRFTTTTTFQAINPYQVILENNSTVINISGGTHMTLEGFIFQHADETATSLVVIIDGSSNGQAEEITIRNSIFRDSYDNDLLKLLDGVRFTTIENNIFYNQGPGEEHIDVNSVSDITIQDNIFFNDYAGSGRPDPGDSKAFITVKDSNEGADGLLGSQRIAIRRNIFLNWQGGTEPFLQIGNDGKPYHEANEVWIENNLMLGNSSDDINATLAISGASNVYFTNNTVVGDMPSRAYALRIDQKGLNPINENIFLRNNIWFDPTGTMGAGPANGGNEFSDGDPLEVSNLILDNNLYWNEAAPIPPGDLVSPLLDDTNRVVADPLLTNTPSAIVLPRWDGSSFGSGQLLIRQEFNRLVQAYARIPIASPALNHADHTYAPADDILGRDRVGQADIGAFEFYSLFQRFFPFIVQN